MSDENDQPTGNGRNQADIRVATTEPKHCCICGAYVGGLVCVSCKHWKCDRCTITQPALKFQSIHRDNLHELLRYRTPTPEKVEQHEQMRRAAFDFCNAILALTPVCTDQQNALLKVREALFMANAAIATDGMH